MLRSLFIIILGLAASFPALAQDPVLERIQAVVDGQLTGHSARSISDHLAARPGVRLCRVDVYSRNLFMEVDPNCRLSQQAIERFFAIHGLHLRCYARVPQTSAPFRLLDPRTCSPIQPVK